MHYYIILYKDTVLSNRVEIMVGCNRCGDVAGEEIHMIRRKRVATELHHCS